MTSSFYRAVATASALVLASCGASLSRDGEPDDAPPSAPGTPPGARPDPGRTPPPGAGPGGKPSAIAGAAPAAGLRRLTGDEYRASVRDLLGLDAAAAAAIALEPDAVLGGFSSVGASRVGLSARHVERFEAASYDLAARVFTDAQRRQALVGCAPASVDDPCAGRFLSAFGRRAFRRPVTPAEVATYQGIARKIAAESDAWTGLSYAVAGMLQAPHFLYRVELGEPDPAQPPARRYTGYEMASRLSYLLTGSTPDDALLDAAERGALATAAGVRAESERLLGKPGAERAVLRFFGEHFDLAAMATVGKDPTAFARFTPELARSLGGEVERVVRRLVFERKEDLSAIFVTRDTFVNRPLAELYGTAVKPTGGSWEPVTLPADGPRAGLLGFAGVLALRAGPVETSPTKRGHFIASSLLCRTIPDPPPGVDTNLPDVNPTKRQTMRERVERHMSDAACRGCHAAMDPLGLALEHFDAIGAHRATDGGLKIDAHGEIDGVPFDGARALGERLQAHPDATACLVRRFYEHATGMAARAEDEPALAGLTRTFEDGKRNFLALVGALVVHDAFRSASTLR
jgi:hypothetical protein